MLESHASTARQDPPSTLVNGTYSYPPDIVSLDNFFDPTQLTNASSATFEYSIPAGFGNEVSSINVPVSSAVEFGNFQQVLPATAGQNITTSVNITSIPSGYLIDWVEESSPGIGRAVDATVVLASSSFKLCSNITKTFNTFVEPVTESLDGTTITLTTNADGTQLSLMVSSTRIGQGTIPEYGRVLYQNTVGSQQSGCSCQRVTEHQPHKKDLVMSLFVHLAGRGVSPRPPPTPQPPPSTEQRLS
jgi:hypothetical protein